MMVGMQKIIYFYELVKTIEIGYVFVCETECPSRYPLKISFWQDEWANNIHNEVHIC